MLDVYLDLPWELRHHVHTFCVEGPYDNEIIVRRGRRDEIRFLVRHYIGPESYGWVEDPTFAQLSPNRIGVDACREMLQAYYRIRTFKFSHDELECVRFMLEKDCLGLDMHPAEHIRHLDLQIQPFRIAQLREYGLRSKEEARYAQALRSLAVLQAPKTIVDIHIDMAEGWADDGEREEMFNDAASIVFQLVEHVNALKRGGLNIALLLEGRWDESGGLKLCGSSMACLNDCVAQLKVACG